MSPSRVPLGDIADFVNGVAFKPDDWEESGGAQSSSIQNLTDSTKPFNRTSSLVCRLAKKYEVSRRGPSCLMHRPQHLRVFVWEGPDTALVNQHIFRVVPDHGSEFDPYYLRRTCFQMLCVQMEQHLHGATMKHVNRGEFLATTIPLPPLAEQKRIAGILDAADALRAKRREALAQLDTLLQSTFLDMFGDPVTNPKGWNVVAFESIGNSRLGKMLDKGKEVGDRQFPYLANTNVQWGRFDLTALRTMDFSESDCEEFKLEDGDLLICEGGEVGRTAIWHGAHNRIYFQKALHRVRLDPTVAVPEYVFQFMWFMAKNGGFRDLTTSATIAHLTGVKLKRLPCPRPPLQLQHRYAVIVKSVEQQKTSQRAHLAALDTLFASLQSRAFRGDL